MYTVLGRTLLEGKPLLHHHYCIKITIRVQPRTFFNSCIIRTVDHLCGFKLNYRERLSRKKLILYIFSLFVAIRCAALDAPPNGALTTTNENIVFSVATYTCKAGFKMIGEKTRQCQHTGLWTSKQPGCYGMQ